MAESSPPVYEFGRFRLDTAQRVLLRDRQPVLLTPKAVDTLIALVTHSGRVVEKKDLMAAVWPDTFVGEDSLTRNISTLRKVLNGNAGGDGFIETLPRRGYRFSPDVKRLDALVKAATRPATAGMVSQLDEANAEDSKTLAVLPLALIGTAPDAQYLGLGLADALITRLGAVRSLRVRPTSAILRYADAPPDVCEAARQLRVASVLTGTLRQSEGRVRVTAQLVNADHGSVLWAGTFDELFTDIFGVEDAIAEQVARALVLSLSDDERRQLAPRRTNSAAYHSYLRGRYFWNKGTQEYFSKALNHFQEAVTADPQFAPAHAGLADCYNMMGFWGTISPMEAFPKAEALAEHALSLDDTLAEAHASLAWARLHHQFDRAAAEEGLKRSIALNPAYMTSRQWHSLFLAQATRFDEAFIEMSAAYALDPLSLTINYNIGVLLMLNRQDDEAIEQFRKTIEIDSAYFMAHSHLALTYAMKGQRDEASAAYSQVEALVGATLSLPGKALIAALCGDTTVAHQALAKTLDYAATNYLLPSAVAQIYAALDDLPRAFEWLDRAYDGRDPFLMWLKVNPVFDGLRADPRSAELLARVGLPSD